MKCYSGLNLNQDKATKPQTVQIVRQGEATPSWFKFNPLYYSLKTFSLKGGVVMMWGKLNLMANKKSSENFRRLFHEE